MQLCICLLMVNGYKSTSLYKHTLYICSYKKKPSNYIKHQVSYNQ